MRSVLYIYPTGNYFKIFIINAFYKTDYKAVTRFLQTSRDL